MTAGVPHQKAALLAVLARADRVEEQVLVVAQRVGGAARVLEAPVEEGLGALHDGHLGVGEVAEGALQQLRARHVIGVERDQELRVDVGQGVVEVAGLGVQARGGAAQVAGAEPGAHAAHPVAAAVVQHPHLGRRVGAHGQRTEQGRPQHVLRLVVGGDQDRRPATGERGGRPTVGGPPAREGQQGRGGDHQRLGDDERQAEPQGAQVEGEAPAPGQVDDPAEQREGGEPPAPDGLWGQRRRGRVVSGTRGHLDWSPVVRAASGGCGLSGRWRRPPGRGRRWRGSWCGCPPGRGRRRRGRGGWRPCRRRT